MKKKESRTLRHCLTALMYICLGAVLGRVLHISTFSAHQGADIDSQAVRQAGSTDSDAHRPTRRDAYMGRESRRSLIELPVPGHVVRSAARTSARSYHTVLAVDSDFALWQTRIFYYGYQKFQKQCEAQGPQCDIGGFTRILQTGKPDDAIDEMPTVVVQPMPEDDLDPYSFRPQRKRQYALLQWVMVADISEQYVFLVDPDFVLLRPLPNIMQGDTPVGHWYSYISPEAPSNWPLMAKYIGPVDEEVAKKVPGTGPAPLMIALSDLKVVLPLWGGIMDVALRDKQAQKDWDWVIEMWAFSLAMYKANLTMDLPEGFMAHVTADKAMKLPYYLLHYTYRGQYLSSGEDKSWDDSVTDWVWRFDKRDYVTKPFGRNYPLPPENVDNAIIRTLIRSFNEATANIPCWDEYAATGKLPKACRETRNPLDNLRTSEDVR